MDDGIRLPEEVLAHIFSFLPPKDKLNAISVCQRWRNVFNENSNLLKDLCVCVLPSTIKDILKHSSTVTRKFSYFKFEKVDIDEECFLFLERLGSRLRRLLFLDCRVLIDVDQPARKLQTCEKLLKLKILNCNLMNVLGIFYKLPALKSLCLEVLTFSEREIVQLQKTIPLYLTELQLAETAPTETEQNRAVSEAVVDFVYKRCFSLESLDLRGLKCQGLVMHMLSNIEGSSLKRVKVFSNYLPRNCIESFCKHHQRIVTLYLRDATVDSISFKLMRITPNVTDSTVVAICNSLPLLEELDIRHCFGVNESVVMIFKLKNLRRLSLYGCNGITKASFINVLNGVACKNLNVLDLRSTFIDSVTLSWLLPSIPNLREITLSHSHYLNSQWVERLPRCPGAGMTFVPRST